MKNKKMWKIICVVLSGFLTVLLCAGCARSADLELSDSDLVEILKLITMDVERDRLSERAENGRVISIYVDSFETENIDEYIEWADARYNKQPDFFFISSYKNPVTTEDIEASMSGVTNIDALFEWTLYSLSFIEYKGFFKPKATFSVSVYFPYSQSVGGGYDYELEKIDGVWKITDVMMTWMA